MVIKSKEFLIWRNLTVYTFVRIESLILTSITFFWLEIIIYEVLLTLRESLLALSQLSAPTSSLFTVAWTLLMSLSDANTVVSSAKWTKRIWFYMSLIYKRKSTGPNTDPCGTPNVMFDIEELQFLIETYCFLLLKYNSNQCCMTPLTPLCRSLLINMLWLTVECFWEI